jgi:hypothetical protein
MPRPPAVSFRLEPEVIAALDTLAKKWGIDRSKALRHCVALVQLREFPTVDLGPKMLSPGGPSPDLLPAGSEASQPSTPAVREMERACRKHRTGSPGHYVRDCTDCLAINQ